MPEHVHLFVSEPKRGTLSLAIQALKTSVSKQSLQRPFWQIRYYDFNVRSSAKRTEKLRYIHRNPVTRSLVGWQRGRGAIRVSRDQPAGGEGKGGRVKRKLWRRRLFNDQRKERRIQLALNYAQQPDRKS